MEEFVLRSFGASDAVRMDTATCGDVDRLVG